jgi:hypothetical protein
MGKTDRCNLSLVLVILFLLISLKSHERSGRDGAAGALRRIVELNEAASPIVNFFGNQWLKPERSPQQPESTLSATWAAPWQS